MDVSKLPSVTASTNPNHLQCSLCGYLSKSHSSLLAHTADKHPCHLDDMPVGRLGNIVFYQSLAKLFHCHECFFTAKDFSKVYDHIISSHCTSKAAEEGFAGNQQGTASEATAANHGSLKRKRSSTADGGGRGQGSVPSEDAESPRQTGQSGPEETGSEADAIFGLVSHNGNRYVCRICGWKTKMKGFCVRHVVARHEVAKPYSCPHCDQAFIVSSMLRQHMNRQHKSGEYRCPFCFFRTDKLRGLRCHCTKCRAKEEGDAGEGSDGEE